MRMIIAIFSGYNMSGAKAPRTDAWCIRKWQATPERSERNYWVHDGDFYLLDRASAQECFEGPDAIDIHTIPNRRADGGLPKVLSKAVMQVVMQWRADE